MSARPTQEGAEDRLLRVAGGRHHETGYDRHDAAGRDGGNSRNGHRTKTVLTEVGPVQIDVLRDRDPSFEPRTVGKRKRRLSRVGALAGSTAPRCRAGPVAELLGRYRAWLLTERGVTSGTARGDVDCVRPFVAGRLHDGVLDLVGVTAADVTGFVLASCPGRAVGSAKLIVCALRSLLR